MKRLAAALLVGLTSVFATPLAPPEPIALGTPFVLTVGASAKLVNWSLTFVRVVSDSRCPPKVQCVWAGDAIIELRVTRDRVSRNLTLHTGLEPRSATALRQRVTLVGLGAKPAKVATFKVSKP